MANFVLRFPMRDIACWAERYSEKWNDDCALEAGRAARRLGYLTREQFLIIARWKSPRPLHHYRRNSDAEVRATSRLAFSATTHTARLDLLTELWGVQHRVASAILHFCHRDPYPLMDIRAFWSLGVTKAPSDWRGIWPDYVAACRQLASEAGVKMRTLDRALWAYSRHQRRAAT
jgi:hypothetical protein